MGEKLPLNPWTKIWVHPRETIRAIIQHNTSYFLPLLYWIYGLPLLLQVAQNMSLGLQAPSFMILLVAAAGAFFLGWVGINLGSILFYWTGKWIGGQGRYQEVRTAVAWSTVPTIVNNIFWVILTLLFGKALFTQTFLETQFTGVLLAIVFLVSVIQFGVAIWGFVILLQALGEAQKFSAWKALLNVVLPLAMIFLGVWLLSLLGSQ